MDATSMSREAEERDLLWLSMKIISSSPNLRTLRNRAQQLYGQDFEEALEMLYENTLTEAKNAIARLQNKRKDSKERPLL